METLIEKKKFEPGVWESSINTSDFVKTNVTPYLGDASFLSRISAKTKALWEKSKQELTRCAF
ncbi:MAG: hypothetical protein H6584_07720 [Flavobacteriales bacterium]|nr:hypothetical protein [Flavobacteriales bacterium]